MGVNDPDLARVRVSTTENGTYSVVGYVRNAELQRGSESDNTLKWLGGSEVVAGDRTLGGSFPIYWVDTDVNGQDVVEAAWASGADLWIQFCPKGTGTGAKVKQFKAKITEAPMSFAAGADAVEGTFSFRGDATTLTTVTLA